MLNINDKIYKFYDFSIAQLVVTIAASEQQAREQLGNHSLIFVARKHSFSLTSELTEQGGIVYAQ